MGAAPGPSPLTVASQFARVYYGVAAKIPSRLPEFYDHVSQLDHGDPFRAVGREAIASFADKLPLANSRIDIESVIGQPSIDGNVIVVVRGSYSSASIPFLQTFLLAKQSDSHDEHFFCCNDIFVRIGPDAPDHPELDAPSSNSLTNLAAEPVSTPANDFNQLATQATPILGQIAQPTDVHTSTILPPSDVTVTSNGGRDIHDDEISQSKSDQPADTMIPKTFTNIASHDVDNGSAITARPAGNAPLHATLPPSPSPLLERRDQPSDVTPVAVSKATLRGNDANAVTSRSNAVISSSPRIGAISDVAPMSASIGSETVRVESSNGKIETKTEDPIVEHVAPRASTAVKKTWASIVSSKDDAVASVSGTSATIGRRPTASLSPPNGAASLNSIDVLNVNTTPSSSGGTPVENGGDDLEATNGEESKEGQVGTGHMSAVGEKGGTGVSSGSTRGVMNGRPMAVGRSAPRTFGPSAVVTLASTGMAMSDARSLTNSLREEFCRYGHKLRGVEVKAGKGIAFIEYENADGVRAAVEAWANGPRQDGAFAGVALNVTEKRVAHVTRRPGSMRGGGRGGPRGGARRGRGPSTPVG